LFKQMAFELPCDQISRSDSSLAKLYTATAHSSCSSNKLSQSLRHDMIAFPHRG
jgi:hypothetical protein